MKLGAKRAGRRGVTVALQCPGDLGQGEPRQEGMRPAKAGREVDEADRPFLSATPMGVYKLPVPNPGIQPSVCEVGKEVGCQDH